MRKTKFITKCLLWESCNPDFLLYQNLEIFFFLSSLLNNQKGVIGHVDSKHLKHFLHDSSMIQLLRMMVFY